MLWAIDNKNTLLTILLEVFVLCVLNAAQQKYGHKNDAGKCGQINAMRTVQICVLLVWLHWSAPIKRTND